MSRLAMFLIEVGFPVPMFIVWWLAELFSRASRFALATSFTCTKSLCWFPSSKMYGDLWFRILLERMAHAPV